MLSGASLTIILHEALTPFDELSVTEVVPLFMPVTLKSDREIIPGVLTEV